MLPLVVVAPSVRYQMYVSYISVEEKTPTSGGGAGPVIVVVIIAVVIVVSLCCVRQKKAKVRLCCRDTFRANDGSGEWRSKVSMTSQTFEQVSTFR